jgi:hypothetical protein
MDGERNIRDNIFFRRIDWNKIEAREVQPPYRPKIVSFFFLEIEVFIFYFSIFFSF